MQGLDKGRSEILHLEGLRIHGIVANIDLSFPRLDMHPMGYNSHPNLIRGLVSTRHIETLHRLNFHKFCFVRNRSFGSRRLGMHWSQHKFPIHQEQKKASSLRKRSFLLHLGYKAGLLECNYYRRQGTAVVHYKRCFLRYIQANMVHKK